MPNTSIEKLRDKLNAEKAIDVWAAVAILLKKGKSDYEVLLVKRADIPSDPWAGDMALPGGKKSFVDVNVFETACRETLEEIGIDLKFEDFLGIMPVAFSIIQPDKGIAPLIYYIKDPTDIHLNEEHVNYRWVPLRKLSCSRSRAIVKEREGPVFSLGNDVVWGLTYRILDNLLMLFDED